MQKNPEDEIVDRIIDEMPSPNPGLPELVPSVVEMFESMSIEDQDEILRLIMGKDGFERLARLVHSTDTPGAMDLFLDRVRYYHFFRVVED
jgi:hypothetical protein